MVQLQDFILECPHHHTLSNMFFNRIVKAHHGQVLSCSNLGVNVWFTIRPIFPNSQLVSPIFFTTFRIWFGLPHPSIASIPWCMCTHPIDCMGIHLLCYAHGNECTRTHDAVCNTFVAIVWDVGFHWGENNYMCFLLTCSNHVNELTLCSPKMAFTP